MSTDEVVAQRNLRKAGLPKLVAQRQELAAEAKELKARIDKVSAKIMGHMATEDVYSVQAGAFKVAMVIDAKHRTFDQDKFTHYLIEHKVAPKLIKKAEDVATEMKTKKPHLRVSGGEV